VYTRHTCKKVSTDTGMYFNVGDNPPFPFLLDRKRVIRIAVFP